MFSNLSLELKLSTPASIGWYDPRVQDPLGLRASEIKGLWRWWSRVCIAGAMYDRGLLKGERRKNIFLRPRDKEVEAISYFVGSIMGLGYAQKRNSEASRFSIYIDTEPETQTIDLTGRGEELQRIKLLTLRKRDEGESERQGVNGLPPNLRFTLVVSKRTSVDEYPEEIALKILCAALQLMGVGKGSRRGLGSLDIVKVSHEKGYLKLPRSITDLLNEIYHGCSRIVESYGDKYVSELDTGQQFEIPPMPVLSKKQYQGVNITQVYSVEDVKFENVHNFFLRTWRCKTLHRKVSCTDDLRSKRAAWVLGLPRAQKGTGYMVPRELEVSRRPSPIIASYHGRENIFGPGAFISVFLSGDWPVEIEWRTVHSNRGAKASERGKSHVITINEKSLVEAYETATRELNDYFKALPARVRVNRVWP